MFNKGDIIFVARSESILQIEQLLKVEKYDSETNTVWVKDSIFINKVLQPSGEMGFISIPDMGLVSNRSVLENGEKGMFCVNLNTFDFYGLVTNSDLLKQFEQCHSKLITPSTVKPGVRSLIGAQ